MAVRPERGEGGNIPGVDVEGERPTPEQRWTGVSPRSAAGRRRSQTANPNRAAGGGGGGARACASTRAPFAEAVDPDEDEAAALLGDLAPVRRERRFGAAQRGGEPLRGREPAFAAQRGGGRACACAAEPRRAAPLGNR